MWRTSTPDHSVRRWLVPVQETRTPSRLMVCLACTCATTGRLTAYSTRRARDLISQTMERHSTTAIRCLTSTSSRIRTATRISRHSSRRAACSREVSREAQSCQRQQTLGTTTRSTTSPMCPASPRRLLMPCRTTRGSVCCSRGTALLSF